MKHLRIVPWIFGTCALAWGGSRTWARKQANKLYDLKRHTEEVCRFEGEGGLVAE